MIPDNNRTLNEYQKIAVEDLSPSCIVKANVGSGKTTVLVEKVKYLHEVQQVSYEDMVVLTFTNKAANEIRERLGCEKGEFFGTFHSVAMSLLKGMTEEEFSVMDPEEELELAQELISSHKLKIKYKNRLKKRLEEEKPAYFRSDKETRYGDDLYLLFSLLQEEKARQKKKSFSDLILDSTTMLRDWRKGLICGKKWPAWILVDEVQDSDRQQVEFLEALMNEETHFFAVGDPNQVIYSWRGGTETMFYEIKNRFHARELSLPINYRSSAEILEAASRFMQNGGGITGQRSTNQKITVRNHYDPFQEAAYLAERIRKLREQGLAYREIAVFYRKQNQAEILEKIFEKEKIPFTVSQRKNIHEMPVLDWMLHVLRYSCFAEDYYAGEAALTNSYYGEGKTRKAAQKILKEKRFAVSALYDRMCGYESFFSDKREENRRSIWNKWYDYWNLDQMIHPTTAQYAEDKALLEILFRKILDYCQKGISVFEATKVFLQSAALYGTQFLEEENEAQDKVRLMTLHASKGLEFSQVFLIGVNQGLIPLPARTPQGEEEERRLFFVGMTRARDGLELSYYTNPGQPGVLGGPGWFLKMLPANVLDWPENRSAEDKTKNLQTLRRAVEENRRAQKAEQAKARRVSHGRYGAGVVVSEDDLMIEVDFENYGKKQFVKALSSLTFL